MWIISILGIFLAIRMMIDAVSSFRALSFLLIVGSVAFLFLGLTLFLSGTFTHIATSTEGIEYYWIFWGAKTSWKNIVEVQKNGILLDKSVKEENRFWHMLKTINGQNPFIPLKSYVRNWQESDLGKDIKNYTLHLKASS